MTGSFYVLATGYDNAKEIVENHIIEKNQTNVLNADGSLNDNLHTNPDPIKEISLLTDEVLF